MGKPKDATKINNIKLSNKRDEKTNQIDENQKERGVQSLIEKKNYSNSMGMNFLKEIKRFNLEDKQRLGDNKFYNTDFSYLAWFNNSDNKLSRKNSRDSESESTSNEDKCEKEIPKISQHKNRKNKIPFKSTASDFKIKYKTELCKYFEINGYCKYGENCAYAHGKENLRSKVTNTTAYRTKKCVRFFETGYCPYGNRCQFAHQLKTNIINNPYDNTIMTYSKILETISKLENAENIKKLVEKPRLEVFKALADNKENIKSRLLDDIKELNHQYL